MTLRYKLAFGAGALALIISLGVWVVSFHIAVGAMNQRTKGLIDLACTEVYETMARSARSMAAESDQLSQDKTLAGLVSKHDSRELSKRLQRMLVDVPNCRNIVVANRDGLVLSWVWNEPEATHSTRAEAVNPDGPLLKKTFAGRPMQGADIYSLPKEFDTSSGFWQTADPIYHKGEVVGILLATYSWDSQVIRHVSRAVEHFEELSLSEPEVSLLDGRGTIAISSRPSRVGERFKPASGSSGVYPSGLVYPQSGRAAATISRDGLRSATVDLKLYTALLGAVCGLLSLAGFNWLIHLFIHQEFSGLGSLSRQLLAKIGPSQSSEWLPTNNEFKQLARTLTVARDKLGEQQENMDNLLAELTGLNEELLQADQLKNEFVANMSHEIRTPMNGILGFAELLGQEKLTGSQREYVQTILRCGRSLLELMNDVLDLARMDAGHLKLRKKPCSIRKLLSENCRLLRGQADEKGLKLTWHVAGDVPELVLLDPGRFRQILTNLTNNAVRYTDRGFVSISVTIDSQASHCCLRLSVADSGIGIPADKSSLIFKPFIDIIYTKCYIYFLEFIPRRDNARRQ